MSSVRYQVIAAVSAAVSAAALAQGTQVYEAYDAVPADADAGMIFGDWSLPAPQTNNLVDRYTLSFQVGIFARGAGSESDADALHAALYAGMVADRGLGGLAKKLEFGALKGRSEGSGGKSVLLTQHFDVIYDLKRNTLDQLA